LAERNCRVKCQSSAGIGVVYDEVHEVVETIDVVLDKVHEVVERFGVVHGKVHVVVGGSDGDGGGSAQRHDYAADAGDAAGDGGGAGGG
jgi:hypothetical protein